MKTSGKIFFGIMFFIIIASLIATTYYPPNGTFEFDEFSIEAPRGSEFEDFDVSDDPTVKEMHRSLTDDLTITSFNATYIEKEHLKNNGEKINYTESLINHLKEDKINNVTEISDNLTSCIQTTGIKGINEDTDVAFIYHDDDHLIFIEGGDIDFIRGVAESIKILN